MTLIKTGLLNGIAVLVRVLTLLGLNKVLAVYVGPAGYAVVGQFQNAVTMFTAVASGAFSNGVVKYTAEHQDDESQQHRVWRTAGTLILVMTLVASVLIAVCSRPLAQLFLEDVAQADVFVWFAAGLLLYAFNLLLLAILNGKKDVPAFVGANIAGSLLSLLLVYVLVLQLGLKGALIGFALYQSFAFFVTLGICWRKPWFRPSSLLGRPDRQVVRNLAGYVLMAMTTAICVPVSHMLVRNHLGDSFGLEYAGYWEAMWRLSAAYLMLVTSTLGVYYLPRLAELKQAGDIRREILQGYRIILPVAAASSLVVFLLRDPIITILFDESFAGMRSLFAPQLLGDTLKIGSWLLAYLMLGKAMFRLYVVTEVVSAAGFVVLTMVCTKVWGFEGVAVAHMVTYLLYWACLALVMRRYWQSDRASAYAGQS